MTNLPWFLTAEDIRSVYTPDSFVALDFETDSFNRGSALEQDNDIVLACWQIWEGGKLVAKKHVFGGIFDMSQLIDDILEHKYLLAFNAKFELQWLKRAGLELRDVLVYDPMLAQWVLDGNRKGPGYGRSLHDMAIRYRTSPKLDLVGKLLDLGVQTRDIHTGWLLEYCNRDVDTMVEIFFKQIEEVDKNNVWHLVHTRNLTCSVLADIEFAGLQLDSARVNEEYSRVQGVISSLGAKLAELTGGINLNSSKQLATYIYDVLEFEEAKDHNGNPIRTSTNSRSGSIDVISKLKIRTDAQKQFIELYKEYNKAVSLMEKSLNYFKSVCTHDDGVFYGQIQQNVTGTHRLASRGLKKKFPGSKAAKGVQLQNIPREYKNLFYAKQDDWEICSYDSSQVEFRVAVDMGKDKIGYEEVINGVDIHSFTAQVLYKAGDKEISNIEDIKERRQQSKKHTFRPLYGGSSGSDALQDYCKYFKNKYSGIEAMQRSWTVECADNGYYSTPYGMTFYFPAKVQRSGYITYTTQIYNFPIQGFATGEIIPIALVHFWHKTRELRCELFVTIHDSIDARVHKDDIDEVTHIAKECLTMDVYSFLDRIYNYKMRVPLGLGFKHAKHWGEGKELKWDITPEGKVIDR